MKGERKGEKSLRKERLMMRGRSKRRKIKGKQKQTKKTLTVEKRGGAENMKEREKREKKREKRVWNNKKKKKKEAREEIEGKKLWYWKAQALVIFALIVYYLTSKR